MAQALSLDASSKLRIPPHLRAKSRIEKLPAALSDCILTFLPFCDYLTAQKTCKAFKCDVRDWTKLRGIFPVDTLFKFFKKKLKLYDEEAIDQMKKIGGVMRTVSFDRLPNEHLMRLLSEGGNPLLARAQDLLLETPPKQTETVLKALEKTPPNRLTNLSLYVHGFELQSRLLPLCPNLTELHVDRMLDLEQEELSKVCPHLTALSISRYGYHLEHLTQFPQLTSLDVGGIHEEGFKNLRQMPNLTYLAVSEVNENACFTNAALRDLALVPNLRELVIHRNETHQQEHEIGMSDLGNLAGAAQLTTLEFQKMDRESRLSLLSTLPAQITALNLKYCALRNQDFASIARCTGLRSLTFVDAQYGQEGYGDEGIARLQSCRSLTALTFEHSPGTGGASFTTQGMIGLVQRVPALRTLDLSTCYLDDLDTEQVEASLLPTHPNLFVSHKAYWDK